MPDTTVVQLVSCSAGRASVVYRCDLQHAQGLIIQLGTFFEFSADHIRALGMIARTELTDYEQSLLGSHAHNLLKNPFDYLSDEFDEAWEKSRPGFALPYLAQRHPYALSVLPPTSIEVPRRYRGRQTVTKYTVGRYLYDLLEDESYSLQELSPDHSEAAPAEHTREFVETAKAA